MVCGFDSRPSHGEIIGFFPFGLPMIGSGERFATESFPAFSI